MKHNAITLLVFPVAFVIFTVVLLYIAIMPVIRPYVDFAGLFISSSTSTQVPKSRDLFADAALLSSTDIPEQTAVSDNTQETAPETIPLSSFIRPNPGDIYGRLTIEDTTIDAPIYWDDSPKELNAGIGTYAGAWLPGFGRTIMMASHRDSWLRDLGSAKIGGIITVETHYETYEYKITEIAVYHMNDSSSYDFSREDENIIIYTCYPFDYIGAAKDRYFVYGELVSGRQVERVS